MVCYVMLWVFFVCLFICFMRSKKDEADFWPISAWINFHNYLTLTLIFVKLFAVVFGLYNFGLSKFIKNFFISS